MKLAGKHLMDVKSGRAWYYIAPRTHSAKEAVARRTSPAFDIYERVTDPPHKISAALPESEGVASRVGITAMRRKNRHDRKRAQYGRNANV